MTEVINHPWDRFEGETARAYDGFRVYLDMGAERSINKAAKLINAKHATHLTTAAKWSGANDWQSRAIAYDKWMQHNVDIQRFDKVGERDAELWAKRQGEIQEQAYQVHKGIIQRAQALMERADMMLRTPLFETQIVEGVDGEMATHIHPNKSWKPADAARFISTAVKAVTEADKLARLSADMATENQHIEYELDLAKLPREVVEKIATGELDPSDEKAVQTQLRLVGSNGSA